MKRVGLLLLLFTFIISGCSSSTTDNYLVNEKSTYVVEKLQTKRDANHITIKYRDTLVDVSGFKSINTSSSSFIEEAYYDLDNQYLILKLNGTYYHWCNVPEYIWDEFKKAESFGKYYNKYIKGEYDCRLGYIPQYN